MLEKVLFQTIQFSISVQCSFILSLDMSLSGATTPGKGGPENEGNEGVLVFSKASVLLEPQYQIVLRHIQDTNWLGVLPIYREAVGIFKSPG